MNSIDTQIQVNAENVAAHRLKRLEYFIIVCVLMWLVFWLYYWYAGHLICSVVCLFQTISLSIILFMTGKKLNRRRCIANLFLLNCMFGLALNSIVQGQALSYSFMFAPFICLAAGQLMGVRAALLWAATIVTTTFVVYFLPVPLHFSEMQSVFDKFAINVGLTITIFFLSHQAEHFLSERTRHLTRLTEGLHEKTRMLELAEETAGVGHWRWDVQEEVLSCSHEMQRICGIAGADEKQSLASLLDSFFPDDADRLNRALIDAYRQETSFLLELAIPRNGDVRHVNCRGFCERDAAGNVTSVFGIMRDDTDLKRTTAKLRKKALALKQLACYDPLTGLANRFSFERAMKQALSQAIENDSQVALMILDMDGFKEVNDTLGHPMGDRVLKETARRLKAVSGENDVVSRFGGDEFTIVMSDFVDDRTAVQLGHEIIKSIRKPYRFDGQDLALGASIGICVCPRDTKHPEAALAFADTAMYEAKVSGNDVVVYKPSMTQALVRRKDIENQLACALERGEYRVFFQPQIDLTTNKIIAFESLIRWKRGEKYISPIEFIPILENSGEIVDVGYWILEQSCQQLEDWRREGHDVTIAVNISASQFRDPEFVYRTKKIISSYDIEPAWIDLEITESLLVDEIDKTADKLFELKSFGIKISIDDFGTGYSSLAYLKHFPIDKLKIDRTFVQDYPKHDDGTIAASIVVLAKTLELKVLAEGVETTEQLEFIRSQGADAFQGYLASRPVPADECNVMLTKQKLSECQNITNSNSPSV